MRIYKIATTKEAKLFDFFGTPMERLEEFSKKFIEDYFDRRGQTPTIGEVILGMMEDGSIGKGITQDFMKTVAQSALATFRNVLETA